MRQRSRSPRRAQVVTITHADGTVTHQAPYGRKELRKIIKGRPAISKRLRDLIRHRDKYRCRYCGRPEDGFSTFHLDHVVPVSSGGPTIPGNLVLACPDCNLKKRNRTWRPKPIGHTGQGV